MGTPIRLGESGHFFPPLFVLSLVPPESERFLKAHCVSWLPGGTIVVPQATAGPAPGSKGARSATARGAECAAPGARRATMLRVTSVRPGGRVPPSQVPDARVP